MPRLPEILMSDPFSSLWERMRMVIKWKSKAAYEEFGGIHGWCPVLVMP